MLLWIIPAAIVGGLIGSKLSTSFSENAILRVFKWVVIGTMIISVGNVFIFINEL
jgi:uncharacterized membrane protein YfcA